MICNFLRGTRTFCRPAGLTIDLPGSLAKGPMRTSYFFLRRARGVCPGRKRRHIRQGSQKIVRFVVKVDLRPSPAVRNRQKNARLTLGTESDIGLKSRASPGLLHHCGRPSRIANLNPSQPDSSRVSRVAQPLHCLQLRRLQIDAHRRSRRNTGSGNTQQMLKHASHVRGSGIHSSAGSRGLRIRAGAFLSGSMQQPGTLFLAGHERRIPHPQRPQKVIVHKLGVGFMRRRRQRIAKKIKAHIGIEGCRAGAEDEFLAG